MYFILLGYKVAIFSLLTLVIGEQVNKPDPIPWVNTEGSQDPETQVSSPCADFSTPLFALVCIHINFTVLLIIKCYDL